MDYTLKLTINLVDINHYLGALTALVNMSLPACHSYRIQTIDACSKEVI